jgi:hypothetical protein
MWYRRPLSGDNLRLLFANDDEQHVEMVLPSSRRV